jgi:hypothetical protein
MIQDPFPGRGHDGEEPDGSGPLPAEGEGPEQDGPEQGLFVCLPAEQLTLAGFAQGGTADTMAPGPLLGTVLHAITGEDGSGLAALADDQLIGVISAARRLESRAAWTQLAAIGELAARRGRDGSGDPAEFAADELAGELHLSWQSAAGQIGYAATVAGRLPRTFAALAAGRVHPVHLRIIEEETRYLSAEDAARADEILAGQAGAKTFGQLRYAAHRLVLRLDPGSALRRKEAARKDAEVRRFREESGNAGMTARELPCDEVLASWQHVEQRALDLRAAGLPGTLRELRVRAYLDLLQERDSRRAAGDLGPAASQAAHAPGTGTAPQHSHDPGAGTAPQHSHDPGAGTAPQSPHDPGTGTAPQPSHDPSTGSGTAPQHSHDPGTGSGTTRPGTTRPGDTGPSLAALVTITVPLAAAQGDPAAAGEVAGFGPVDAQDARDLLTAAARDPRTRWCVTAVHPDGTAAAHGCAPGPIRWPPGALQPHGPGPPPGPPPGPGRPGVAELLAALNITLNTVIRGPCDHSQAERRYRPGRRLRHLIRARSARCTAPGCGRPAARCDLDHTTPWHHGGLTCPCNIAPLCRHHHRCKQARGWWLEQPEPGVLVWRTPSGRTYTTTPTVYAV